MTTFLRWPRTQGVSNTKHEAYGRVHSAHKAFNGKRGWRVSPKLLLEIDDKTMSKRWGWYIQLLDLIHRTSPPHCWVSQRLEKRMQHSQKFRVPSLSFCDFQAPQGKIRAFLRIWSGTHCVIGFFLSLLLSLFSVLFNPK